MIFDNLHFVSPSHWMASCVRQSFVSRDKDVYVIPNAVNEAVFKRIDKKYSRYILDIDLNKKIISFGCNAGINNPIKGWNILLESLRILKEKYMYENIQVVIFGSEFDNSAKEDCPYPIEFLGIVNDEVTMSIINCAADVFVTPSLAESFGMTALENIYCGTPVVAYNHGGVVDFIQHKVNISLLKIWHAVYFFVWKMIFL